MSNTHLHSNITVDPGQIAAFADFLNEVQSEIAAMEKQVAALRDQVDFGVYPGSKSAHDKHQSVVQSVQDNLFSLSARATELAEGTHVIADRYRTVESLNSASASGITAAMSEGADSVKEEI